MKVNRNRLALYSLYLSGLAIIVAIVLFIIQGSLKLEAQVLLGLSLIGVALSVLLNPQKVRKLLARRQARYGSNVLIAFVAFLGIVVALNYIVNHNTVRWDLTEDKEHSLAPETLDVLKSLKSQVQANAFFTASYPSETTANLLDSFKFNSNGKFDYKFINPDSDPILAQEAGITQDGSVVLTLDGRSETLTYATEQNVASALVRLSNPGERTIYFLTGHGEYDITSTQDSGLSQVVATLKSKNYTVKTINLLATPVIPSDALSIIIAGNIQDLSVSEIEAIKTYQDSGGALIVWSTPKVLTKIEETNEGFENFLSTYWGISLGNDMIVDLNIDPPIIAYGSTYGKHPITENLATLATLFPRAHSVTALNALDNISLTLLVSTGENSWAETEISSIENNQVSPDADKDIIGPVPLAFAGENSVTDSKIVVVGNAEFAANAFYSQYGNLDLAINMIDWASDQDNLLNLTAKQSTTRTLVSPTVTIQNLLLLVSVILLPGIVLIIGVVVWVQRRKRG
jgi:ABC-type uncharacterized transport system involved in gliding motility auxiliary subunit